MNIFILDEDPRMCARYHCDKHVGKMILESAQMLSTVMGGPYKPTHQNHPCTVWAGESRENALWLIEMAGYLNCEYKLRYGHDRSHKSWIVIRDLANKKLGFMPDNGLTPFAQAMPEEFKRNDPVASYRDYYKSKSFARWDHGPTPYWW